MSERMAGEPVPPVLARYRALIVDDERLARVGLRAMLADQTDFELAGEASNGNEAAAMIRTLAPDLVFLDIHMPDRDGFRMLAGLAPYERPAVVFVTAHREYALDAFGVNAVDYLLKPFSRQRFAVAMQRAARFLRGAATGPLVPRGWRLAVHDRDRLLFIEPSDVRWFEAYGNYVRVAIGDKLLLLKSTLSTLVARLDPASFVRISRSALVNLQHVHGIRKHPNGQYELILAGGVVLRSSRRYGRQVRAALDR
jgi:two-component system LytT family response regulator